MTDQKTQKPRRNQHKAQNWTGERLDTYPVDIDDKTRVVLTDQSGRELTVHYDRDSDELYVCLRESGDVVGDWIMSDTTIDCQEAR